MVRALHEAGLEVILDVVYNHTAEGNQLGPTLSFRGIDNASYYRLHRPPDRSHYFDSTGTGNSLLMSSPHVLQLIMDSLRYWVLDMHVDGFRFDLASALARSSTRWTGCRRSSTWSSRIRWCRRPSSSPSPGTSATAAIRSATSRRCGLSGTASTGTRCATSGAASRPRCPEFASRLTGSADLYDSDNRHPIASVNFVTCHDGFTLADLVSYDHKHNEANAEDNADGTDDNRSWNCGAEGPTDDPAVLDLRARQQRNFLATLLLSQGVPMLLSGDEFGRSQGGNNNGYCQDNETSWVHWPADRGTGTDLTDDKQGTGPFLDSFVRSLIRLRASHPVFRRRRFFTGEAGRSRADHLGDIRWLTPSADEMTDEDWAAGFAKSLIVFLNGKAISEPDQRGERITDDTFLLMFNAAEHDLDFTIPPAEFGDEWIGEIDTADPQLPAGGAVAVKPGETITLLSRSLRLFRRA